MKTLIIIKREFLTRVRKKSFILLTILVPILLVGLIMGISFVSTTTFSSKNIAIFNQNSNFEDVFISTKNLNYTLLEEPPKEDSMIQLLQSGVYDGYLYIPNFNIEEYKDLTLLTYGEIGMEFSQRIQSTIQDHVRTLKMEDAGINSASLAKIEKKTVKIITMDTEGKKSNSEISLMIGYLSGFLLYFFMLFYGMNVMNSVMEEKTNRIAEIIVSSVTPFQLMFGKIIGVALVGLTQFLIWGILIFVVLLVTGITGAAIDPAIADSMMVSNTGGMDLDPDKIQEIALIIGQVNWLNIISWFIFYFLGGYFLYAALYAAVGSLVNENIQEGQQFTIPITIPIIFSMVLMSSTIQDPHNSMAVFGSIFPLTSPIVMMARLPYGVPGWQLLASAASLIVGFILATGMAAKIYRTGILMYGKKITFAEVGKWLFKK